MPEIGVQGQEILVDTPESASAEGVRKLPKGQALTSWLVGTVKPWRDHRDMNYIPRIAEYWRLWRGIWDEKDKNRASERSRLIAPALSQAIEAAVAEIEESLLSKEVWFDLADDVGDQEKIDASLFRDQLLEDLELTQTTAQISEAVLVSAITGQGTLKCNTDVAYYSTPSRGTGGSLERKEVERVFVRWESYRPDQIIPDPAGKCLEDMMGFAFESKVSRHKILEKIEAGIYSKEALPFLHGGGIPDGSQELDQPNRTISEGSEEVKLLEYHGKVPAKFLNELTEAKSLLDAILADDTRDLSAATGPLVEAVVTVADDTVLLRAIPNPFTMKDRSVVTFSWEKVPGRFWGRGVAEKGFHPQKALDAEMRARADALGYVSAPMMGMDAGRIPRGFKPEVKPGKIWLTQGPPDEVLRRVDMGTLEPSTFNQTSELMQMVQMGTGMFDSATGLRRQSSSGGSGATTDSMMLGAFVKRAKRAVKNISDYCLVPLVQKSALRYMQFDPVRYPFEDTKFVVKSGMGIIAREVEQLNLTQLMAMLPEEASGIKVAVAQGILEMSSVTNKAQILQAMHAFLNPSEEQQAETKRLQQLEADMQEAERNKALAEADKVVADTRLTLAKAESEERLADDKETMTQLEGLRVALMAKEIEQFGEQNELQERRLDLQEKALNIRARQTSK